MEKNYKSDFDIILTLKTCVRNEDGTCSKRDVGWPEHDWVATFRTDNGLREYVASRKGDTLVNCFNDNGRIHVVFNNHRLGKGVLRVDFHSEIPNAIYPDGIQDLYEPQPLDIELVDGPGDCAGAAEVEVLLPYIKGDRGEKLTYGDLTAQDKEDLIAPIKESINKAITEKQDKLSVTADFDLTENLLSLTDTGKRRLFDDMWASINGTKLANGNYRMGADGKELTYAEALVRYERNGFIKKWNAACRQRYSNPAHYPPYGRYNEATGFFELNGITDIDYTEAVRIYMAYVSGRTTTGYRTNIPVGMANSRDLPEYIRMFTNTEVEIIRGNFYASDAEVLNTHTLREINSLRISYELNNRILIQSTSLEIIRFSAQNKIHAAFSSFNIKNASKFRLDGIAEIVDWVQDSTVLVHPDVYAKLTGDTTNEAAAALTEEELAQWMEMAAAADNYNIIFATT